MKKSRVLFVSPIDLSKYDGGSIACENMLRQISHIFKNEIIDVISLGFKNKPSEYNTYKINKRSFFKKIFQLVFFRVISRSSLFVSKHINLNNNYDYIFLNNGIYAGDIIKKIKNKSINTKIVVIHHNFEFEYHSTNKGLFTLYGMTNLIVKHLEKYAFHNSDINIFFTKNDRNSLVKFYGKGHGKNFVHNCIISD